ncbi:hypothetical protein QE152_g7262 [Popillia japonica]|uniref:Uncharacterized protein n=1 Tax=Popillia japonica TaxID=7064 RepID=A0AAW1MF68_POPJA
MSTPIDVNAEFDFNNSTPIDVNAEFDFNNNEKNYNLQKSCRQIIGSLMYAVQGSRPDLCESVNLLSRYQDKANDSLLKALKRVLRYVKGSISVKLIYRPNCNTETLLGYVDADWGLFKLLNCTISWTSKKQQCVSISSTESEYIALSAAVCEDC